MIIWFLFLYDEQTIKYEESTRIQNVERDLANIQSEISKLKLLIKEALNGSR